MGGLDMPTQTDRQLAKIKASMRKDINGITDTADLLTGKQSASTRLTSGKKVDDPFKQLDDPKNLTKFLKFMEAKYAKNKLIHVELKKSQ